MDMYERTQRNPYFDFLRGIAMIMVVGIHTFAPFRQVRVKSMISQPTL